MKSKRTLSDFVLEVLVDAIAGWTTSILSLNGSASRQFNMDCLAACVYGIIFLQYSDERYFSILPFTGPMLLCSIPMKAVTCSRSITHGLLFLGIMPPHE